MADTLHQLVVWCPGRNKNRRYNFRSARQAEGSSDQVTKLFSTIRGGGWPRLNSISAGVEIWPSATANGTE